jgi:hypothetical protein
MEVRCTTEFSLYQDEAVDYEGYNRDDLLQWLADLPRHSRIVTDWSGRSKLVAIWTEER